MFVETYRPKSIDTLVGASQRKAAETLTNLVVKNQAPNVLMLVGSSGIGKTTIAKMFADWVMCEHPKFNNRGNLEACGVCSGCNSEEFNVRYVNCSAETGIDTIRDIISKMYYTGFGTSSKVYILDEVQGLTKQAQNALLTPLEKIPPTTYFVFATTDESAIIEPLKSRAMMFRLTSASYKEMQSLVMNLFNAEDFKASEELIDDIISSSSGNIRTLVQNVEMVVNGGDVSRVKLAEFQRNLFVEILYKDASVSSILEGCEEITDFIKLSHNLVAASIKVVKSNNNHKAVARALRVIEAYGDGLPPTAPAKHTFIKRLIDVMI